MAWWKNRRTCVLLAASGVSFMIMLDSNIVAVSTPSIARELNASFSELEWVISAYVLAFASFLMPAGTLADRYGRRRMLLIGLWIFGASSLACGLAPNSASLNGARALQGLGAAVQLSAALAVLGHEFQGAERARAFGFWGSILGIAVTAGPIVGGLITTSLGWRWAFLVNIPTSIALIVMARRNVHESSDVASQNLDVGGMLSFGTGLLFIVWALIDANMQGWLSAPSLFKVGAACACLFLFFVIERSQARPMVDLDLFRRPTFLGAAVAMLGYAASAQVMVTFLPLYLQNVFGFGPAGAGMAMLAYAIPLLLCPRVAARLSARVSSRAILTIGLTLVSVGNGVTALMAASHMPYSLVWTGMLVIGAGAGLLNGETVKVIMNAIPSQRGGMASGLGGSLRFVGIVLGFACLGYVLTTATQRCFDELTRSSAELSVYRDATQSIVSRIAAGDLAGLLKGVAPLAREQFEEASRRSFEVGFAALLFMAAMVSGLAAILTFWLVCARETAPLGEASNEPAR